MWRVQFLKEFLVWLQVSSVPASSSTYEDTKERKQQVNGSTNSYCPPQGTFNKIITDGMWTKCTWEENEKYVSLIKCR